MAEENDEIENLLNEEEKGNRSEEKPPSKIRQWILMFALLFLILISRCTDTMIFPFFPILATAKGLSNLHIGLVFSSYDLSRFIASPIFGSLVVKWHPKSMCGTGTFITALSCIAFGTTNFARSGDIFLALCLLIRFTAGIGSAMVAVSATTILMKSTSYEATTIAGIMEMVLALGYAAGPALGAAIYQLMGYTPMFCFLGALLIAFLPLYAIAVPKVVEEKVKERKGFLTLMAIPGCLLVFVHCTIMKVNGSARSTEISKFVTTTFQTSSSIVALLFVLWSAAFLVASLIFARFTDKRYVFHTMLVGWMLMVVLILLLGPSPLLEFIFHNKKYLTLTAVCMAVANAVNPMLFIPPFQAALGQTEVYGYERDSVHTYGMIAGMINSGLSLGSAAGPILSGALVDAVGFPWTMTISSGSALVMAILIGTYLVYMKMSNKPLYLSDDDVDDASSISADGIESVKEQINAACADRMDKCLKENKLTQTYRQQPAIK